MTSISGIKTVALIPILTITIAIINSVIVTGIHEGELNVMFGVMRARGYHLFANAIATSDIHYDLRSDGNFTLFAPINSALFSLDMTMAASNYVTTVRYHVVPRRMSIADLLSLPPGSNSIPTLNSGQNIVVEQRRSLRSLITVGGVDIVVPGLYYGRDVAVHGLEGILEYRPHHRRSSTANVSVTGAYLSNLPGNLTEITGNYTFDFPKEPTPSPRVSNSTRNKTMKAEQSPQSSGVDQNQTVTPPVATHGSVGSRAKLLELSSDGTNGFSMDTEPIYHHSHQFNPVDGDTVDCSVVDHEGDKLDSVVQERKLESNMICVQK
ncbi:uncharacterized protein [Rutidosis leptorrhynchoides]|uniref:uncharacterized protein n=1 Tax=Rutidosis leptorrhynchoides TaxID=125765 RepID=UPI003A9967F6